MSCRIEIVVQAPKNFASSLKNQIKKSAIKTIESIPKIVFLKKTKLIKKGVISVAVVGVSEIKSLNLKYRKKNKPTDVLSFSRLDSSPVPFPMVNTDLGDVLICWKIAKKQAIKDGVTFREELSRLTIHGVLHLFGYDHEISEADEKKMFRLQDKILKSL